MDESLNTGYKALPVLTITSFALLKLGNGSGYYKKNEFPAVDT